MTTLDLLPGDYSFHAPLSSSTATFPFSVTAGGTLDFDASLDAYVSGRGSNTLTVTGFPVTFDATALSAVCSGH